MVASYPERKGERGGMEWRKGVREVREGVVRIFTTTVSTIYRNLPKIRPGRVIYFIINRG